MKNHEDMSIDDLNEFAEEFHEIDNLGAALMEANIISMAFNNIDVNDYDVMLLIRKKSHEPIKISNDVIQYPMVCVTSAMTEERFNYLLAEARKANQQTRNDIKRNTH